MRAFRAPLALLLVVVIGMSAVGLAWGMREARADDQSPSASASTVTLRVGWTREPDNLNPFIGWENSSFEIWALNYSFLFGFGANEEPFPDLATEIPTINNGGISPDGTVWTIHLRPNVQWQDGTPLTAEDVAWTYNFIVENELSAFTMMTRGIKEAKMIDPATVQIICFKPKADMTRLWVPILPKHIWSKVGAAKVEAGYINRPPIVGSGPFQVAEFKRGRYVRMTRSDNYWGKKPAIDEIIFQVYQNSDTLVQDLKAGTIDAAWEIPQAQLGALKAQKGVEPVPYNYFNWDYLSFNCYASQDSLGNPVLRDPAFRRALNYAVDRESICKITWQGHAVPGTTIITPNSWKNPDYHWQPPADQLYTFNLATAARLLDDAGYPLKNGVRVDKQSKPIKLRLWALNSDIHGQSEGKLIAGWFGQLGLRIVYSVIDEGALEDRLWEFKGDTYTPNFDMYLWDWDGYNDPGQTLSTVTSDQIGSWNEPCWSNAQYDQLAAEQASTLDLDKRKQFIDQLQQIMYDQSPWLVLTYPEHLEAYNTDKWTGWTRVMDGRGPAFYSAGNVDTYLNLQPQAVEKTSRGNGLTIALIGVAAVVVLGSITIWLFLRRRVKAEED